jgi:hypothetical protein
MMEPFGLRYQKIDMCPNLCILYYLNNTDLTQCITYGHAQYKSRTDRGKTLITQRKMRYFSITLGLQRLFMSPMIFEHMTWHHSHDTMDWVIMHLFDGVAWKYFNRIHPQFLIELYNIHIGLCTYRFNLFR